MTTPETTGPEPLTLTVADMAARFTPSWAASELARTLGLRQCAEPAPEIERLLNEDPGHRWFMYCLEAVARTPQGGPA